MARTLLLTVLLPTFLASIASAAPARNVPQNHAFTGPRDNWEAPHIVHANGHALPEEDLEDVPPLPRLTRHNGVREDSPSAPHNSDNEEIPSDLPSLTRQHGFREDSEDEIPEIPELKRQHGFREDSDDELPELKLERHNGVREDPEIPELKRQHGKIWPKKN